MRDVEYGLGIDIGDGAVAAAVCGSDGAEARPLTAAVASATVELRPNGSVRLGAESPDDEAALAVHVMARVGSPVPVWVGGRGIPAADLAAAIVRGVRARAEAQEGRPPGWTVVTIPPSWGAYRSAALTEALGTEAKNTSLVSAAVAVTRHHVGTGDLPGDPAVAVYDAGASTLDTAVVGLAADGSLEHVAVPPGALAWGGSDIDDAVLAHVLPWLDPPACPSDGARARALRAGSVAVKESLSTDTVAHLDVEATDTVRVTREELDELIEPDVERTVAHLRATIEAAGLTGDDLDAVVLAGGCARVPLLAERLSADLGRPIVVAPEPEFTAALGAARLASAAMTAASAPAALHQAVAVADPVPARHIVPSTVRETPRGAGGTLVRPPAGAGSRSPGGMRRPSGGEGDRRAARVLIVAAMFAGLVLLVPALLATLSSSIAPAPAGSAIAAGATAAKTTSGAATAAAAAVSPGTGGAAFADVQVRAAAEQQSTGAARVGEQRTRSGPAGAAGTIAPGVATAGAPTTPVPTTTPPTTTPPTTPVPTTPVPTTPVPTTTPPTTPVPTTPVPTTPVPTTPVPTTPVPDPQPEPVPEPAPAPAPEPAPVEAPPPGGVTP